MTSGNAATEMQWPLLFSSILRETFELNAVEVRIHLASANSNGTSETTIFCSHRHTHTLASHYFYDAIEFPFANGSYLWLCVFVCLNKMINWFIINKHPLRPVSWERTSIPCWLGLVSPLDGQMSLVRFGWVVVPLVCSLCTGHMIFHSALPSDGCWLVFRHSSCTLHSTFFPSIFTIYRF